MMTTPVGSVVVEIAIAVLLTIAIAIIVSKIYPASRRTTTASNFTHFDIVIDHGVDELRRSREENT